MGRSGPTMQWAVKSKYSPSCLEISIIRKKKARTTTIATKNVKCNVEVLDVFCNMSP